MFRTVISVLLISLVYCNYEMYGEYYFNYFVKFNQNKNNYFDGWNWCDEKEG